MIQRKKERMRGAFGITAMLICGLIGLELTSGAGCPVSAQENETDDTKTESFYEFTDDSGAEIVLAKQPQRTAVLFSSFADVWVRAGGETAITVGESVERGFTGEDALLVDRGAGKTIDSELLVSYEPDFVICSADIPAQAELAELLNGAEIPCAQFHVESFEEYLSMLRICTDITGDKDAYRIYGTEVGERIEQIKAAAAKAEGTEISEQPQILFIRAGSGYSATKAKTADNNFVCTMLKELGTYNIAENAPVLLDGLSFEEILMADPEFIFISTMGDEEAARRYMDQVMQEENWQQLDAVKNGRFFYLPKELFQFKPNARWDEAYQYLAEKLAGGSMTGAGETE